MDLATSAAILSSLTTFTPSDSFMNLDVDTSFQKKMELMDQTPKMTTKHWQRSVSKRLFKLSKTKQSLKRILPSLLNLLSNKKKLRKAAWLSTPKSVSKLTEIKPMPSLGS